MGGSFWNGTRQHISQELQLLTWPRKAPYYLLISYHFLSLHWQNDMLSLLLFQVFPRTLVPDPFPHPPHPQSQHRLYPFSLDGPITHCWCFGYPSKCHFHKEAFPDHSLPLPKLEPSQLICCSIWHLVLLPPSTSHLSLSLNSMTMKTSSVLFLTCCPILNIQVMLTSH